MNREFTRPSFRQDANMAGAIFISNTATRYQCFRSGVFGLTLQYQAFVENVKQGMPLFLFDCTERKLYGVFEAASDGGMNINNRTAFRSTWRTYPAQVCFKIIWKCRPLAEDEFSHAIKENYYHGNKFYFDLSYNQVARLFELFENKRSDQPIHSYTPIAHSEKDHFSKGGPDKRSLTANISPISTDQSHTLIPSSTFQIPTAGTNYSPPTSMRGNVPHNFEPQTNVPMPLVTKPAGLQIDSSHSRHHVQNILPYHNNTHLQHASTVDGISTQVYAPCPQTNGYHRDQFVTNQSYPISHDYMQNSLSSGRITANPIDGIRLSAKQSYVGTSRSLQHIPQVTTGGERNYDNSTPYGPSYPFSLSNPQGNANLKDKYDLSREQYKEIYKSEQQHLSKERALTPPFFVQQGIPAYPEVPEVSAIGQRKDGFRDYNLIADCALSPSDLRNVIGANMSDQLHTNREMGAESNTTVVPGQDSQNSVFSRISWEDQPLQEAAGPSRIQMLHLLSKRTEKWSSENRKHISQERETRSENKTLISHKREEDRLLTYDAGKQPIDITCPLAELNLPNVVEGEKSTEPPFLDFKRRRETAKLDANSGKEISGKMKRRKLVRPSFGENNNPTNSEKEIQVNGAEDREDPHINADGNKVDIDLNKPSVDNGPVNEGSIVLCPADMKTQTGKPHEVNTTHKPKCSDAMEVTGEQDHSVENASQTGKVSLDLNVADLNTMDESKLQAILDSPWLQALDKLRNGKSNNSEVAKSSRSGNDNNIKMEMSSDGSANPRCS